MLQKQEIVAPYAVYAGSQTEGRGQREKIWSSEPFANMLASFLVSESSKVEDIYKLNNAAALAVVDVLQQVGLQQVSIKWPNDVYVKDNKIAGILIENTFASGTLKHTIIGIGLNVNQKQFSGFTATSILNEIGHKQDVISILHNVYDAFYYFIKQDKSSLLLAVNQLLYKQNESVTFDLGERTALYQVERILANGKLRVRDQESTKELEHHLVKWKN
jgi:BirA family transcriptional regulator, biotin operon repressor / biotin---[acetyl-CoA-carboxylase] ligase